MITETKNAAKSNLKSINEHVAALTQNVDDMFQAIQFWEKKYKELEAENAKLKKKLKATKAMINDFLDNDNGELEELGTNDEP